MSKYPNTLGRIEAVWDKLGGEEGVDRLLRDELAVVIKNHIINCSADPFVPDGWKVEKHTKSGNLQLTREGDDLFLDGKKIAFPPNHMGNKSIDDKKSLEELAKGPILNANVLDYLLAHPDLIPDSWKVDERGYIHYIFFWGTVYCNPDGILCARCLYWDYDWACWRSIYRQFDARAMFPPPPPSAQVSA